MFIFKVQYRFAIAFPRQLQMLEVRFKCEKDLIVCDFFYVGGPNGPPLFRPSKIYISIFHLQLHASYYHYKST